jgi:ribonucleoside-triphosphate reductase
MGLRWVRKRDGRRATFDVRKLSSSLRAAAADAGESILAEEIAEVVSMFLEKQAEELLRRGSELPSTSDIQDIVEKVLLDTNHPRTAAALADRYREKGKRRDEITVRRATPPPSAPDGEPLADAPPEPWNEGRIARTLEHQCGLRSDVADEVASEVERRIFGLGLRQITSTLVREVVNAELIERGFHARLETPEVLEMRADEVKRRLVAAYVRREAGDGGPPGGPEAAVGIHVLGAWTLAHVYPEAVAKAHAVGTLHLQDVGRPLRVATGAVALDWLKRSLGPGAPRSAAELMTGVATLLAAAGPHHGRAIGLPYANVFLAPFARGREASVRRDLREGLRVLAAASGTQRVLLHMGPLPEVLRDKPPVGVGARRWKTGYGELATETERVTSMALELIGEVQQALGNRQLHAAVSLRPGAPLPDGLSAAEALMLERPGLAPQVSHGLVPAGALAGESFDPPFAGGALQVVGINCARAAYEAGPGGEPDLREQLMLLADLACEAFAARKELLETTLYKPPLPLWEGDGDRRPPQVVEAPRSRCVVGLVGLDEAMQALTGERTAQNPAVAELAGDIVRELDAHLRRAGAARGVEVVIEEPSLPSGAQRLTDLDLQRHPEATRRAFADCPRGGELYGTELALPGTDPASAARAIAEIYAPLGLSPWITGSGLLERARAMLDEG